MVQTPDTQTKRLFEGPLGARSWYGVRHSKISHTLNPSQLPVRGTKGVGLSSADVIEDERGRNRG